MSLHHQVVNMDFLSPLMEIIVNLLLPTPNTYNSSTWCSPPPPFLSFISSPSLPCLLPLTCKRPILQWYKIRGHSLKQPLRPQLGGFRDYQEKRNCAEVNNIFSIDVRARREICTQNAHAFGASKWLCKQPNPAHTVPGHTYIV